MITALFQRAACALSLLVCLLAHAQERVLHFELENQLPMVQVKLADGTQQRLLLDLGGQAALALRPEVIAQLGLEGTQAQGASTQNAFGTTAPARAYAPVRLAVGSEDFGAVPVSEYRHASKIAGYIGMALLKDYRMVFDYGARSLRLMSGGTALPEECAGEAVRYETMGNLIVLRTQSKSGPVSLGVDSGANMNVLGRAYAEKAGLAIDSARAAVVPGLVLGAGAEDMPFHVLDTRLPNIDGFLGYEFFSQHLVCIDPAAKTMHVVARP